MEGDEFRADTQGLTGAIAHRNWLNAEASLRLVIVVAETSDGHTLGFAELWKNRNSDLLVREQLLPDTVCSGRKQ